MSKKKILTNGVCAAALAVSMLAGQGMVAAPEAHAMVVYDPTNHTETLATKLQLMQSYQKQLEQFQVQLKQLSKLDSSNLSNSVRNIQNMVSEMNNIRSSIGAIGNDFRTAQAEFDDTFTDFSKWNGVAAKEYSNQAARINAAVEKGIKQSIVSQGLASPEEMQKTADSLSFLLEASQNADGVVGVTQAASQIAALQIKETQRLQAIMSDSMKGQNLYLEKVMKSDEKAAKIAAEFYQTDWQDYVKDYSGDKAADFQD